MNCREFRKKFSYTLKDLSIETGYSISAISKWERECETMPQDFVDKVFGKFGFLIEKQHRNYVFNDEHAEIVEQLKNEIDNLYKIIDKLQNDNVILTLKIQSIQKICKE